MLALLQRSCAGYHFLGSRRARQNNFRRVSQSVTKNHGASLLVQPHPKNARIVAMRLSQYVNEHASTASRGNASHLAPTFGFKTSAKPLAPPASGEPKSLRRSRFLRHRAVSSPTKRITIWNSSCASCNRRESETITLVSSGRTSYPLEILCPRHAKLYPKGLYISLMHSRSICLCASFINVMGLTNFEPAARFTNANPR